MTRARLDLGCGQGSGSSQTGLQRRPWSSGRGSQWASRADTDSTSQWQEMRARPGARGLVPLPAQALDGLEAHLDPEAQSVPAHPCLLRGQAGEDDPGFLLPGVPSDFLPVAHAGMPALGADLLPQLRAGYAPGRILTFRDSTPFFMTVAQEGPDVCH